MYQIAIHREFCAAHAIVMRGEREPMHGHTWRVRVVVEGDRLDADGLLVDFHLLERSLLEILAPFDNRCFNDVPPFDRVNPTAELIARHIADHLAAASPLRVVSVCVGEAPGCEATYIL